MKFKKIDYNALNSKQKEIFNFQKVAGILADYGFNCIKLADDWQGADFIAYHKDGKETLRVQLKSRITIDKKYQDKDLYIIFPFDEEWYLILHDELVDKIKEHTNWLNTPSWAKGYYSSQSINPDLLKSIEDYAIK